MKETPSLHFVQKRWEGRKSLFCSFWWCRSPPSSSSFILPLNPPWEFFTGVWVHCHTAGTPLALGGSAPPSNHTNTTLHSRPLCLFPVTHSTQTHPRPTHTLTVWSSGMSQTCGVWHVCPTFCFSFFPSIRSPQTVCPPPHTHTFSLTSFIKLIPQMSVCLFVCVWNR